MQNNTALTAVNGAQSGPLPHKDYAIALLTRASVSGSIPAVRLNGIRTALHEAAAERAAAYTRGRSTTVTRTQAEAFYKSVLCQLDAALLLCGDDAAAEEALRSEPLAQLLETGQLRMLQCYENAKTYFRKAYQLTKPVQTSFFHALLADFEQFCTKYDARFRADDTKVRYTYPLIGGLQISENSTVGVCRYYEALMYEGELLHCFEPAAVQTLMKRYAALFRTSPDMIAENIAELVLRHWLLRALCGELSPELTVTQEMIASAAAEYAAADAEMLAADIRKCLRGSSFAENAALLRYLEQSAPYFAETLTGRIAAGRLEGWFAAEP